MKCNQNIAVGLWILTMLVLLAGYTTDYLNQRANSPEKYARQLEAAIHTQEREVDDYFRKTAFLEQAISNTINENTLAELGEKKYTLCIYDNNELLFWSNNKALAYSTETEPSTTRMVKMVKLQKGYHELIKDNYTAQNGKTYTLVALIPIYYEYILENDYSRNAFALLKMPKNVRIAKAGTAIRSSNRQALFRIKTNLGGAHKIPPQSLILYLLGFCLAVIALTYFATMITHAYGSWIGVPFFIFAVFSWRVLAAYLGFTSHFASYELFSPRYYALNDLMNSLGDLFINIILIFWVCVFTHRRLRFRRLDNIPQIARYLIAAAVYSIICSGVFFMGFIYKSLVLDSEISLEIDNIFSLNIYSFVGLLSLTILAAGFFFLTHKLMLLIKGLAIRTTTKMAFAGAALLIFTVFNVFNLLPALSLSLILFTFFIVILFDIFIRQKSLSLAWLFGWIIVFSMFSSVLLYQLNVQKNLNTMRLYAERLAEDGDRNAERRLDNMVDDILNDNFIKNFFQKSFIIPRKEVIDRLERRHIKGYLFNQYDHKIHTYNTAGKPIRSDAVDYADIVEKINAADATSTPNVYLWSDGRRSEYIVSLPIKDKNEDLGRLVIEFSPRGLNLSKVYPELLLDNYSKTQKKFDDFDFAIYKKDKRIRQKDKTFGETLEFDSPENLEFVIQRIDGRQYLIHRPTAEKVVIVSSQKRDLTKPFSLFSYMFCLQFAVFMVMVFINRIIQAMPAGLYRMNIRSKPSLRSRINLSVISVIIISFVAIGAVTVLYFQQEFEEYHQGRLERKVRGVLATANNEIQKHPAGDNFLPSVNELSEINNMDINLYDLKGSLLESSQQEIFDRGLISSKIDPIALYQLRNRGLEKFTQDEKINTLSFLAAYVPLYNAEKVRVAYLGLPYFSRQSNLRQDVSDFMGTLLNVYVLLFLIAGIVALFVGNSVTQPIVVIGEKLKKVKLGTKNERLTWENDDEIGALVSEYNKMINELQNSAKLLAQSNRELAWREMARQVAHEIKNPLTPMRLSIQHLQRVYKTDPDQISRLSTTILEQIDNLSHIASEFSNFAQMPRAERENFILDDLVTSVYDLFKERDNIDLNLSVPATKTAVFADKKQMMRVFNNLIKNAIQAIPEERTGKIDIILEQEDDTIITRIIDNGVGIPEEKKSSIFVPNFTTKSSGTGLGLAISRNIVENANGSIYFESEENIGTTFYVELPVVNA